jgi:hypothetical protein
MLMTVAIASLLAFLGANVVIAWYAVHTHAFASHAAPPATTHEDQSHG